MLAFFMKKAFFDGWDNLFSLVLVNLGFVALVALGLFLPPLFGRGSLAFFATIVAILLLGAVWWAATVQALVAVADFGKLAWRDGLQLIKKAIIPGLQFGLISIIVTVALYVGLPFYLSHGGFFGALAAGLLLWLGVIFALSFQWFLPLRARFGGGFAKNFRKCFIFAFDNVFFSFFVFLYNVIELVLSVVSALLLPGFAGLALNLDDAVRIRALKYDYLEVHPGIKRNELPWDEILVEERELVGPRTLKGMIFPWKE
jgi:hypothetical protein